MDNRFKIFQATSKHFFVRWSACFPPSLYLIALFILTKLFGILLYVDAETFLILKSSKLYFFLPSNLPHSLASPGLLDLVALSIKNINIFIMECMREQRTR